MGGGVKEERVRRRKEGQEEASVQKQKRPRERG